MKCPNCGFVTNGEFSECPYCGQRNTGNESLLSKPLRIDSNLSVKRSTLINVVLFNLLLVAFFIDAFTFRFRYGITVLTYVLIYGLALVTSLIVHKKSSILSNYFRVDVYLFFLLVFSYGTLGENFVFGNWRPMIGSLVVPIFFLVTSIVLVGVLLFGHPKIRLLEFVLALPLRFSIMLTIFVFWVIANNGGGEFAALFYTASSFPWANFDVYSTLTNFAIVAGFASTGLVALNFTIYWVLRTISMVHYTYGK